MLGPETDDDHPQTDPSQSAETVTANSQSDPERGTGRGASARTMAVSGPGLNDLHTDGPKESVRSSLNRYTVRVTENRCQVFDLERHPGPVEERLDHIELLLNQLVDSSKSNGFDQRLRTTDFEPKKPRQKAVNPQPVQTPQPTPPRQPAQPPQPSQTPQPVPTISPRESYTRELGHVPSLPNQPGGQHTPFARGAAGAGQRRHIDE